MASLEEIFAGTIAVDPNATRPTSQDSIDRLFAPQLKGDVNRGAGIFHRVNSGFYNIGDDGSPILPDPQEHADFKAYSNYVGLDEQGKLPLSEFSRSEFDFGEVVRNVGEELRNAWRGFTGSGDEEKGASDAALFEAFSQNIEEFQLLFGRNPTTEQFARAGEKNLIEALPDIGSLFQNKGGVGGSLVGELFAAARGDDDEAKREAYMRYRASVDLGRRQAKRFRELLEENPDLDRDRARELIAAGQFLGDPTTYVGAGVAKGGKLLLSGAKAQRATAKALARRSVLTSSTGLRKAPSAALKKRFYKQQLSRFQQQPLIRIPRPTGNSLMARGVRKSMDVAAGGSTAATLSGLGYIGRKVAEPTARGIRKVASNHIVSGSAGAGILAYDYSQNGDLLGSVTKAAGGVVGMRLAAGLGHTLIQTGSDTLRVAGRAARNRYNTLTPIVTETKMLNAGVSPKFLGWWSTHMPPMASRGLFLAARNTANVLDNAVVGGAIDGVVGYAITGTLQGALEEAGTGMVYSNAGYYGARGAQHFAALQNSMGAPRGAGVGFYFDPLKREADERLVNDWIDVQPDPESRQQWRQFLEDNKGDATVLSRMRTLVDASLLRGTQVKAVDGTRYADVLTHEWLKGLAGGTAADRIWSEYASGLESGSIKVGEDGKVISAKTLGNDQRGEAITAKAIQGHWEQQLTQQNPAVAINIIDDATGEAVPAALINLDAPDAMSRLDELASHESWHVMHDVVQTQPQLLSVHEALLAPEAIPEMHDKLMAARHGDHYRRWEDLTDLQKMERAELTYNEFGAEYFENFFTPLARRKQGGFLGVAQRIRQHNKATENGTLWNVGHRMLAGFRNGLESIGVKAGMGGIIFDANGIVVSDRYRRGTGIQTTKEYNWRGC